MFGFNNTNGVTIDKNYIDNLKEENKNLLSIFLEIYEAVIDKDIDNLKKIIPNIQINHIVGNSSSKEKWLNDIENESIKYYGVDIQSSKVSINNQKAKVELTSKIRAKLYEYNGSWTVDSYLILENLFLAVTHTFKSETPCSTPVK